MAKRRSDERDLQNLEKRFWSRVNKNGPMPKDESLGQCWVWTGTRHKKGYGQLQVEGRKIGAHQVGYFLQNDYKLRLSSTEPCVLHKCDNPPCVRGSHLFAGTPQNNTDDMVKKGRNRFVEGGRIGGRVVGRKNVESGHLARISIMGGRAQSSEDKAKGGRVAGRKAVESGRLATLATFESCSKGGVIGGRLGMHTRWHVRRNKPNPDCEFCIQEGRIP